MRLLLVGPLVVFVACSGDEKDSGRSFSDASDDSANTTDVRIGTDGSADSDGTFADIVQPDVGEYAAEYDAGDREAAVRAMDADQNPRDATADRLGEVRDVREAEPVGAAGAWSMGYYAAYGKDAYPVSAIHWIGLTHLAIAFYLPNADGSLDETLYHDEAQGQKLARDLVAAAHSHGVKVIASLGGATSQSRFVSATTGNTRATFVSSIVKLASDYGFDGIDVDWEPLDTADQPTVIELATAIRTAAPRLALTIPLAYVNANNVGDLSGFASLARVFDQVNLMTYGMAGTWPGWKSWHSSALYHADPATPSSVDSSVVAYVGAGVPKNKLGIGIGFYGLCYSPPIDGPAQVLSGAPLPEGGAVAYSDIMDGYFTSQGRRWDSVARVPYLSFGSATGSKGCGYLSYEDEQSIAEKGAYLKSHGLGGVIVWQITQGHRPNADAGSSSPLLQAIYEHILR